MPLDSSGLRSMIRSPLGLRLDPDRPTREQIRQAASLGAKGVVIDAVGELSPGKLGETGRREVRHLLRSVELSLIALSLPTRRPFDSIEGLDERLNRAELAFSMAFELGTKLVLARVGPVPDPADVPRRSAFETALRELGKRADHRGITFAVESGTETGKVLAETLESLGIPTLAASLDPGRLLLSGIDPVETTRELGAWVSHAYLNDASKANPNAIAYHSKNSGFPAGALDWEEYLGALEEINYRGYLTVPAGSGGDTAAIFKKVVERVSRF